MEEALVCGVRARVARTFAERMRGLIGTKDLGPGEGMLIVRCGAIHTFFMSFAIDAVFLDRRGRIVRIVRNIPPWRPWVWGGFRAASVLEVKAGGSGRICANHLS